VSTASFTWDEVYAALGPLMYEDAPESKLEAELSRLVAQQDSVESLGRYFRIDRDALHTIKTQLLALGLIQRSTRRRAVSDTETYWSLSIPGERHLMKLRALQRG